MARRSLVRAFTLIELLVVAAVLALLIAILLPSLAAARERAKRAKCAVNLRNLARADFLYAQDSLGYVSRNSGDGLAPSTFFLLADSQKCDLTPVTPCPFAGATGGFETEHAVAYSRIRWFQCPCFPISPWAISYIVSGYDPNNPGTDVRYLKLSAIKRPSDNVNFTEVTQLMPVDNFEFYDLWKTEHVTGDATKMPQGAGTERRICNDDRHRGAIVLSYYDEHVETDKKYKNLTIDDFVGK